MQTLLLAAVIITIQYPQHQAVKMCAASQESHDGKDVKSKVRND